MPWTNCYPNNPNQARELAITTGVLGIQVYPADIFSHVSDSKVINAINAYQNSKESRAEIDTQFSPCPRPLTTVSDSTAVTEPMESRNKTKNVPRRSDFCSWKEVNDLSITGSMPPSSDGVPRAESNKRLEETVPKKRQSALKRSRGMPNLRLVVPPNNAAETV